MEQLGRIMMVEDDPRDVELTLTALEDYKLANEVVVTRDGEEALDYLYYRGNFTTRTPGNPAVLLLDLKLPKVDGLEVLQQIRSDEKLGSVSKVEMAIFTRPVQRHSGAQTNQGRYRASASCLKSRWYCGPDV